MYFEKRHICYAEIKTHGRNATVPRSHWISQIPPCSGSAAGLGLFDAQEHFSIGKPIDMQLDFKTKQQNCVGCQILPVRHFWIHHLQRL